MQKTIVLATILMLVGLVAPPAAAETVTESYTGAAGVRILGVGPAVMCPNACLNEDFAGEQPNIGGAHLRTSGTAYTNVVVAVNDEGFWGSTAAISTCFWNPGGDNICNEDDYGSQTGCGGASLTNSPFAGDYVTVWVRTFAVTEALDICGGTFGTVSGDFF